MRAGQMWEIRRGCDAADGFPVLRLPFRVLPASRSRVSRSRSPTPLWLTFSFHELFEEKVLAIVNHVGEL